jgi:glycosyltransferase involved in cell wall biosynthesis
MKVIVLVHHFWPPVGGAEISLMKNLKELKAKGYDCEVFCFLNDLKPFQKSSSFDVDGIKITQKKFPTTKSDILKQIKSSDVVITMLTLSPHVVPLCLDAKKPVINIVCDDVCFSNIEIFKSVKRSHAIIVNSLYTQDKAKLRGLESFVLFPDFNRSDCGETVEKEHILFCNPRWHKGYPIIRSLIEKFPKEKFVIVGDTGFDVWQRKNIDLLIRENVEYTGTISDEKEFDRIYKKTKVTLVPSQVQETFHMVAAESVYRNIPVIASGIGALPQTVGDCGIIVSDHSNPISWYKALDGFLSIPREYDFEPQKKFYEEYSKIEAFERAIMEAMFKNGTPFGIQSK